MRAAMFAAGVSVALAAGLCVPALATAAPDTGTLPADTSTKLAGKTVFLDPGHQGSQHSENLSKQVPDGRGGQKDCQTTGMTSVNGVPEHTINWNVAKLVQTSLESLGAKVVLSRNDDTGWGGCVDDRAKAASASGADVAISIHADSTPASEAARDHGFHMIVPQLPVPDAKVDEVQSTRGLAASTAVRDAYKKAGFSPANYAGVQDGMQTRADIAGPALTTVPLAFVEMGNGANAEDAKVLESGEGQLKHAVAITTGLVSYLLGVDLAKLPAAGTTKPGTNEVPTAGYPTPKSTYPGAGTTPSTDKATDPAGGMLTTVLQMIRPVLSALGIPESLLDSGMVATLSDLASKLVGAVLQAGGTAVK